jgi:hypothetical protein
MVTDMELKIFFLRKMTCKVLKALKTIGSVMRHNKLPA